MLTSYFTWRRLVCCILWGFIILNFLYVFLAMAYFRAMSFGFSLREVLLNILFTPFICYIPAFFFFLLYCQISKLSIRRFIRLLRKSIRIFLFVVVVQYVCVEIFCFLDERHFMNQVQQNPDISYDRPRWWPLSSKLALGYSCKDNKYYTMD